MGPFLNRFGYIILLIALSLLALWPFFKAGYFESHDGEWMVIRFTAFHQTLASGQLPVRFVDRLNNNYGYPVLNFLYPLPFYLAEIPKILGFGFVDSIKIVFVVSTVISVVAMFWALSSLFDKRVALASSLLYLFIPYRFVDFYVRGSLGENLAFAVVPLIAGSIFRIANEQKIFQPILAIGVALLVLSHNVMAVLFLPFFALISFILIHKGKFKILLWFLLGITSATFFWLPALYDLQFVRLSQMKVSEVSDHLVNLALLFIPVWGYGPNPNGQNPLPVQIGIVPLFITICAIYLFLKSSAKESFVRSLIIILIAIIFLMTKPSLVFWQNLPFADIIQFPWRLLSLVVFIVSLLTAYVISNSYPKNILVVLVIGASIVSTIFYTKPRNFINRGDNFYATNEDTTTVRDEYLPLWVTEKPQSRASQKIELQGGGEIISSETRPAKYQAVIKTDKDTKVQVNTTYFPGWRAEINGHSVPIDYQNKFGLITFNLPQGMHKVIIKYTRSPVHLVSELISVIAITVTGGSFFLLWRRRKIDEVFSDRWSGIYRIRN